MLKLVRNYDYMSCSVLPENCVILLSVTFRARSKMHIEIESNRIKKLGFISKKGHDEIRPYYWTFKILVCVAAD